MSTSKDTYLEALEAVLAALNDAAAQKSVAANTALGSGDVVQGARAVGEQTGMVDAYLLVQNMVNRHCKAGVA